MQAAAKKEQHDEVKPKLPDPAPRINVSGIPLRLLHDWENYSNGSMMFRFSDTQVDVQNDDGKKVGSMGAAIGGGMFIEIGKRLWVIDREALFDAVQKADAEFGKQFE